jgi:hypothetical protein
MSIGGIIESFKDRRYYALRSVKSKEIRVLMDRLTAGCLQNI